MTHEIWPYWGVREPVSAGSHFPAFLCSIYATLLLWRLCRGDRPRQWAMLCYGLSMIAQYGASTLYHSMRAAPAILHALKLLDQSAIFCLIAGSYTPTLYVLIRDPARRLLLLRGTWTLALLGILTMWLWAREPYWLTVSIYIGLGAGGLSFGQCSAGMRNRAAMARPRPPGVTSESPAPRTSNAPRA